MNEDRLRSWLRQADGPLNAAPDGLARSLRQRRRRREAVRAAGVALAMLMVVGAARWNAPPPAVADAAALAELRAVSARLDALSARIAAFEVAPPRRKVAALPAGLRRELADARSAALLAWHAERRWLVLGDKADALVRFRALVELFPETPAGRLAVARIETLVKEIM